MVKYRQMRFLPAIFVLFLPVCVHAARLEVSSLSVLVRPLAEVETNVAFSAGSAVDALELRIR